MRRHGVRSELKRLKGYHFEPRPGQVKLDQNESPYDVPAEIKERVLARFREIPWNRYPPPFADRLTGVLADRWKWTREGIVVGGGSNVLVQAVLIATSLKGRVVVLDPSFYLFEMESALLSNRIVKVPLGDGFSFPTDRLKGVIRKIRPTAVLIANPNAPTGTLFPVSEIMEVVKVSPCLVVVDEAYAEFSGVSLSKELENVDNLLILKTFSKALGGAGVRLGYLLAAPKVAREVRKVLLPFSVSSFQMEMALALLEDASSIQNRVQEIVGERRRMEVEMRRIDGISVVPTQANFIAFRGQTDTVSFERFLAHGIAVRDISRPGVLKRMLRVTVGRHEENDRFLEALRKIASSS